MVEDIYMASTMVCKKRTVQCISSLSLPSL